MTPETHWGRPSWKDRVSRYIEMRRGRRGTGLPDGVPEKRLGSSWGKGGGLHLKVMGSGESF